MFPIFFFSRCCRGADARWRGAAFFLALSRFGTRCCAEFARAVCSDAMRARCDGAGAMACATAVIAKQTQTSLLFFCIFLRRRHDRVEPLPCRFSLEIFRSQLLMISSKQCSRQLAQCKLRSFACCRRSCDHVTRDCKKIRKKIQYVACFRFSLARAR